MFVYGFGLERTDVAIAVAYRSQKKSCWVHCEGTRDIVFINRVTLVKHPFRMHSDKAIWFMSLLLEYIADT